MFMAPVVWADTVCVCQRSPRIPDGRRVYFGTEEEVGFVCEV